MGCGKLVLAVIFPPLAVLDKGGKAILVTFLWTLVFWVPGIIAAFHYNGKKEQPTIVNVYQAPPPPDQK